MTYLEQIKQLTNLQENQLFALNVATYDLSKTAESVFGVSITSFDLKTSYRFIGNPTDKSLALDNISPHLVRSNDNLNDLGQWLISTVPVGSLLYIISANARVWTWPILKACKKASPQWEQLNVCCWDLRDIWQTIEQNSKLNETTEKPFELFAESKGLSKKFGLFQMQGELGIKQEHVMQNMPSIKSELTMKISKTLFNKQYPDADEE